MKYFGHTTSKVECVDTLAFPDKNNPKLFREKQSYRKG